MHQRKIEEARLGGWALDHLPFELDRTDKRGRERQGAVSFAVRSGVHVAHISRGGGSGLCPPPDFF